MNYIAKPSIFQVMRCDIGRKRVTAACHARRAFEMFIVLVGSVARYYWDFPGWLIPSMVGFTVNPDQWC